MPQRSWLAKVKNVREVGASFYAPLGGKRWDRKQDELDERRRHRTA